MIYIYRNDEDDEVSYNASIFHKFFAITFCTYNKSSRPFEKVHNITKISKLFIRLF